jgi:lysophospholipase L1-like esterase
MGKYKTFGSRFDRVHRNDLNANFAAVEADINAQKNRVDELITGTPQPSEVVDARGGFPVLSGRLDDLSSSLAQSAMQALTLDTDIDTNFKIGTVVRRDYIQKQQAINISEFYKKVRNSLAFQVCARGDSLTYGFDNKSADIRTPFPTTFPDGTTNTDSRASNSYPEALGTCLNTVYPSKATVIIQAKVGATAKSGYDMFKTKHNSDMTIISYGTNDASVTNDISQYILYLEKMIIREVLWGSAVVFLTPLKDRANSNINTDIYRNALKEIAKVYGIPVVDSQSLLKNYNKKIYATNDYTHFNGLGYGIAGTRLSAAIIGEGLINQKEVYNGTKLLSRTAYDNIVYISNANRSLNSLLGETPSEDDEAYVTRILAGGSVIYAFYCKTDDMIVVPSNTLYQAGEVNFQLDFGLEQPETSLDSGVFATKNTTVPTNVFSVTSTGDKFMNLNNLSAMSDTSYIHITTEGWHTLKVTQVSGTSYLSGLDFIDYKTLYTYLNFKTFRANNKPYEIFLGTSGSDTTDRPSSTVNVDDLATKLDFTLATDAYWRGTALKITILSYDQALMEYLFVIGDPNSTLGHRFIVTPLKQFNMKDWEPTVHRLLSNVTYDSATRNLTLVYGGTTNRSSKVTISLY